MILIIIREFPRTTDGVNDHIHHFFIINEMSADGTLERTVIQCLYFFMQTNLYLHRFPYNISFTISSTTESLDLMVIQYLRVMVPLTHVTF